jgi:hypothetical protein
MSQIEYEQVVTLAEQLTPIEQQALIAHLSELGKRRELRPEEWKALFESIIIDRPISGEISFRREDWYSDDGR